MITVVGGTYFEYCHEPYYYQLYGSGLRAACALSKFDKRIKLISCVGKQDLTLAKLICTSFGIKNHYYIYQTSVRFSYYHPLSLIDIAIDRIDKLNFDDIQAENVLYYGMIDSQVKITSEFTVYDAQNGESLRSTNSSVQHLAIILNLNEALQLAQATVNDSLNKIGKRILKNENAELVIIKNGPKGAHLVEKSKITFIPVFETRSVWPIGSGDIFSAAFARKWMIEKLTPSKAAHCASRYTAHYCQSKLLPLPIKLQTFKGLPFTKKQRCIYLAGPFFNISERWLINEFRSVLIDLGNKVFSPLHDVGFGNPKEVAQKDLVGLINSDTLLAIVNGLDAGTLFEIGFAISKKKKVIIFAEDVSDENLLMLIGTGCEITADFSTAVYKASW